MMKRFLVAQQRVNNCLINYYSRDAYRESSKLILDWEFFAPNGICLYSGTYGFTELPKILVSEATNKINVLRVVRVVVDEAQTNNINDWEEIRKLKNVFRNSEEYKQLKRMVGL